MFTIFNTALSALSAVSTAVNVVGNNLANLNTTGYKTDTVSFQDLMNVQLGAAQGGAVGIGVAAPTVTRSFTQGTIQQSTGPFDAAIQGQGFFVVRDNNNQQLFTRAGNFTVDASGHLLTATGQFVQGWNALGGTMNVNGAPADITIPLKGMSGGTATTTLAVSANLDAGGVVGGTTGTYSAPVKIVDSLGASHTLTITFTRSSTTQWDYSVDIPAADLTSGGTTQVGSGSLTFDAQGNLDPATPPVSLSISNLANGAANQTINWDLVSNGAGLITQFAQKSAVSGTQQDGLLAGQITSIEMADGGLIVAHYSSGQQQTVAQVALASITNPDSLLSTGNNNLAATPSTAPAVIGPASSAGRGEIVAGALENSTVDIATEFTNLITLQRSYSADSRVVTTGDEMIQDLMNVKR